jgi:hypothetical protein
MPPFVFSSLSMRFTTTRSCKGRNFVMGFLLKLPKNSTFPARLRDNRGMTQNQTAGTSQGFLALTKCEC